MAAEGVGIYSIQSVSAMTDIPVSTLRYWESAYGLVKPERTAGGHRLYSAEDLERLRWLKARIDEGMQSGAAHRLLALELRQTGGAADAADRRGAIMIMVAERDPITADLEQHFLRQEGYEVHLVLDGRKAVDEAEDKRPDLIIIDIILPGLNGLKVCRALKESAVTRDIPVLVFSVVDAKDGALRAGADAFLLKPLDKDLLVRTVRDMLARKVQLLAGGPT